MANKFIETTRPGKTVEGEGFEIITFADVEEIENSSISETLMNVKCAAKRTRMYSDAEEDDMRGHWLFNNDPDNFQDAVEAQPIVKKLRFVIPEDFDSDESTYDSDNTESEISDFEEVTDVENMEPADGKP